MRTPEYFVPVSQENEDAYVLQSERTPPDINGIVESDGTVWQLAHPWPASKTKIDKTGLVIAKIYQDGDYFEVIGVPTDISNRLSEKGATLSASVPVRRVIHIDRIWKKEEAVHYIESLALNNKREFLTAIGDLAKPDENESYDDDDDDDDDANSPAPEAAQSAVVAKPAMQGVK